MRAPVSQSIGSKRMHDEPSSTDRRDRKPEDLIYHAVRRMLPKNKLASQMLKKLKIYAGPEHPHAAQQVQPLRRTGKKVTA